MYEAERFDVFDNELTKKLVINTIKTHNNNNH